MKRTEGIHSRCTRWGAEGQTRESLTAAHCRYLFKNKSFTGTFRAAAAGGAAGHCRAAAGRGQRQSWAPHSKSRLGGLLLLRAPQLFSSALCPRSWNTYLQTSTLPLSDFTLRKNTLQQQQLFSQNTRIYSAN